MPGSRASHWVAPPAPIAPGLRIGLFGGSFNPAHDGHRHASLAALDALGLDFVWWLVSPQNPLKPAAGMADLTARLAYAKSVARHPRIRVTDIENALRTRFTIDTVNALRRRFPDVHFVWLMGSDNLVQFPRWYRWQEIFRSLPLAIVARPGTALTARRSKAAIMFESARRPADRRLAVAVSPAWAILEWRRRSDISATALRAASRG